LVRYGALIQAELDRLLGHWAKHSAFELHAAMQELALRVVCRTLLGQSFSGNPMRLARAMRRLQEAVLAPEILPAWLPSPAKLWCQHQRALVDREADTLLKGHPAQDSLLAELRAACDERGAMTREQLKDEVINLILAGHETTALALTWAFYLIALHPHIDAAILAEIAHVTGGGPPSSADTVKLELCQRVVKETMRLYPPIYAFPRQVEQRVKVAGYWLPEDAEIWIWSYFMQRDARWFSLPERFNPDRFLPGGEAQAVPRAYIPFGSGMRACIGRNFALAETVLVLASVLQRFRVELVSARPTRARAKITLCPARPLTVRLRPRTAR
jgi:cytochrome P450